MTLEAVPIPMPPRSKDDFAAFSKHNAQKLARTLRRYVGKKMALYGGGWGGNVDVAKLVRVRVEPASYDSALWHVIPTLKGEHQPGRSMFSEGDGGIFEPHLGSWKLAKLVRR